MFGFGTKLVLRSHFLELARLAALDSSAGPLRFASAQRHCKRAMVSSSTDGPDPRGSRNPTPRGRYLAGHFPFASGIRFTLTRTPRISRQGNSVVLPHERSSDKARCGHSGLGRIRHPHRPRCTACEIAVCAMKLFTQAKVITALARANFCCLHAVDIAPGSALPSPDNRASHTHPLRGSDSLGGMSLQSQTREVPLKPSKGILKASRVTYLK